MSYSEGTKVEWDWGNGTGTGKVVKKYTRKTTLKIKGSEVTRDAFLKTIWSTGSYDLGGVTLAFGAEDNQGMDRVFLTVIQKDGSFKPVARPAS